MTTPLPSDESRSITDYRYVLFTSYRKNGLAVATPVWFASLPSSDGLTRACFTIAEDSGKAKRLRHTSRVILQGCDVRGRVLPGSVPISATAHLVSGPECEPVNQAIKAKYGLQFHLVNLASGLSTFFRRRPNADTGVIVTF